METYIATILIWAPNFAPRAWAYCAGQLMAISQNTALYSLLGTTYGGDGRTTFALPDLRSRVPIGAGMGPGPGLHDYRLGAKGGVEYVTLNQIEMPVHGHSAQAEVVVYNTPGTEHDAQPGSVLASGVYSDGRDTFPTSNYAAAAGPRVPLSTESVSVQIGSAGGGQSHENRMPFEGLSYIIALYGIFPSRG
ncbi:phage tail protein [Salinarimonas rosea]|uniref:phage tail protein n=1 Tax=Salinarimonas rosea TaxID=552063 RepID=UPI00048FDA8D|nr:tail fiber protein [Salinarimonas rosea]